MEGDCGLLPSSVTNDSEHCGLYRENHVNMRSLQVK